MEHEGPAADDRRVVSASGQPMTAEQSHRRDGATPSSRRGRTRRPVGRVGGPAEAGRVASSVASFVTEGASERVRRAPNPTDPNGASRVAGVAGVAGRIRPSAASAMIRREHDGADGSPGFVKISRSDHTDTLAAMVPTDELTKQFRKKTEKLRSKMTTAFGVKGMNYRRSKEAREWRQALKDAAREQGRDDVDVALAANPDIQYDTERAYFAIQAKKKIYSDVKDSIETVLAKGVEDLVEAVWIDKMDKILNAAASRAQDKAWLELRGDPGSEANLERARKTARAVALDDLAVTYQAAYGLAHDVKRLIVNRSTASAPLQPDSLKDLDDGVKDEVKRQKLGATALEQVIEADSVESGMGAFGKLLDQAVGASGDQIGLAVEIRVPIAEGPGYVSFTLTGKAARGIDGAMTAGVPVFGDPRRLEVMIDLAFKVGLDLIGLDMNAGANFFLRAGADDTALCMKSLSYGAYRALGAISHQAANWWAGKAKGVDEGKAVRAESWAAMVEEQAFKHGGGYVDIGLGVGGSAAAKFSAGGNGFEAGLAGTMATFAHYDEKALKKSLGEKTNRRGDVIAPDQFAKPLSGASPAEKKQAAEQRRERVKPSQGASWGVSASVKAAIEGQSVTFAGSLSGPIGERQFGLEISATIGYSASSASTTALERWGAGLATSIADLVKSLISLRKAKVGGTLAGAADITQISNAGLANAITDGLAKAAGSVEGSKASMNAFTSGVPDRVAALGTSSTLQVAVIFGYDGDAVIARLEIRSGRKLEFNATVSGAGIKVTAEKSSRLFAVGYDKGGWDAEGLGVRARGRENQTSAGGVRGKHHT